MYVSVYVYMYMYNILGLCHEYVYVCVTCRHVDVVIQVDMSNTYVVIQRTTRNSTGFLINMAQVMCQYAEVMIWLKSYRTTSRGALPAEVLTLPSIL